MAKKCGVCETGDLIPSGCGCLNPACFNFVEKWRAATGTYAAPRPIQNSEQVVKDEKITIEPVPPPELKAVPAEQIQVKRKRGRPKKQS